MDGRFSVAIDDVKKAAIPVLRHRVSTNFQAQAEGKTSEDIIQQLLETVGEPEPPKYEKRRDDPTCVDDAAADLADAAVLRRECRVRG